VAVRFVVGVALFEARALAVFRPVRVVVRA
jgi:hypothetical protein